MMIDCGKEGEHAGVAVGLRANGWGLRFARPQAACRWNMKTKGERGGQDAREARVARAIFDVLRG